MLLSLVSVSNNMQTLSILLDSKCSGLALVWKQAAQHYTVTYNVIVRTRANTIARLNTSLYGDWL